MKGTKVKLLRVKWRCKVKCVRNLLHMDKELQLTKSLDGWFNQNRLTGSPAKIISLILLRLRNYNNTF